VLIYGGLLAKIRGSWGLGASLVLNSGSAVLALRAFAFVKISTICAVYMAAARLRALESPYLLIMIRALERGLSK
jgi:hypothetical protein